MREEIDFAYPSIEMLREKAKRKIPGFAFDYLDGGCNNEINLALNTSDIRSVKLCPHYLRDYNEMSMSTIIFGKEYSSPFGIAPVGLQGLIWPGATEILAKAAFDHNVPFILSTVATADIEKVATITEGNAWFQLYHPAEEHLRNKIIDRLKESQYDVLVILADTPTFGYRPKEIKNGLAIPPRMTTRNILQMMSRPHWSLSTLLHGQPEFKTLKPYLPKGQSLKHLGLFMNKTFNGRLNEYRVKSLRDLWPGKMVIKGLVSEEDAEKAISWGLDGLIVSNHGGRQIDIGQSSLHSMKNLTNICQNRITLMMDGGMKCGPDIANVLASGAEFAFLGRAFMYGVAALGSRGGDQVFSILNKEFSQVMQQLGCKSVADLKNYIVSS
jgi:L-lactate dehydrogenase (cytochrome)